MNKILADAEANRQWLAYAGALGLLLAAVLFPRWLAVPAGLAFAAANGWLWLNLWCAFRRYGRYRADILNKLAVL
jgi:O-antigen/teichoic acid export membrane protein